MKQHQRKRRQQRKNKQGKAFRRELERAVKRALFNMPKVDLSDEEINRIRIALDARVSNAKLLAPFPWEVENEKRGKYKVKDWPRPGIDYTKSPHHPANWPKPEDVARAIMEKEPQEWALPNDFKNWPEYAARPLSKEEKKSIIERDASFMRDAGFIHPPYRAALKLSEIKPKTHNEEDEKRLQKIKEIINGATK